MLATAADECLYLTNHIITEAGLTDAALTACHKKQSQRSQLCFGYKSSGEEKLFEVAS